MYQILEGSAYKMLSEAKSEIQALRRSFNDGFRDLERVQDLQRSAREAVRREATQASTRSIENGVESIRLSGYNALWVCGLSPQTRLQLRDA